MPTFLDGFDDERRLAGSDLDLAEFCLLELAVVTGLGGFRFELLVADDDLESAAGLGGDFGGDGELAGLA